MKRAPQQYYLRLYSDHQFRHGGVGYVDAEKIFERNGYIPITLPEKGWKPILFLRRIVKMLETLLVLPSGSRVVFIFPVYARMYRWLLRLMARRGVRLTCLLADLDGMKDGNTVLLEKEVGFLRLFSEFIVHNGSMKQWLQQNHPSAVATELQLFDFLVGDSDKRRSLSPVVVFAGALAKSGFLLHLDQVDHEPVIQFNIYGSGLPQQVLEYPNCSYKGVFDPYQLPNELEGSFGLVWDGDGIAAPEGSYGHYMSMISQHKLSLYIVSGLPIIIHASAACAGYVQAMQIGFVLDDLRHLPEKIKALPEESYYLMRRNLLPVAERIRDGLNLSDALKEQDVRQNIRT